MPRCRHDSQRQYERPPRALGGRFVWYGAADVSLFAERDWRPDTSLQGGLVTRTNGRIYRIYAQWYDGPPTLGQFMSCSEAALSLGFKMDL